MKTKKAKKSKSLRRGKSLEAQKPLRSGPSISEIVITKPTDAPSHN